MRSRHQRSHPWADDMSRSLTYVCICESAQVVFWTTMLYYAVACIRINAFVLNQITLFGVSYLPSWLGVSWIRHQSRHWAHSWPGLLHALLSLTGNRKDHDETGEISPPQFVLLFICQTVYNVRQKAVLVLTFGMYCSFCFSLAWRTIWLTQRLEWAP